MRREFVAGSLAAWGALAGLSALSAPADKAQEANAEAAAFFESKVRPILFTHCFSCHSDKQQMAGLRLDSRAAMLKGGSSGPVLIPGQPDKSALARAVHYDGKVKMPPAGKLKAEEIAALTEWVKMGAPWPQSPPAASSGFRLTAAQKRFWSFRPVKKPTLPKVKNAAWGKTPIDRFILAKLEAKSLKPAAAADRRALIRRATFDLTGLPPTPEEVAAFLSDKSPDAYAKVIDRLLASSAYGERWGRHWLDVARYTDSLDARGLGGEGDIAEAWRYRDWVVNALNRDLPYSEFIRHQIAGDVLPFRAPEETKAGIVATGLLAIGNWGNGDADKEKILTDIADDQIDVISRGFMGLTVACARCHDHKFDPISTKDYYGLAGIFFSTHILPKLTPKGAGETPLRVPLLTPEEKAARERHAAHLAEVEKRLDAAAQEEYAAFAKSLLPETSRYLLAVWDYTQRPAAQSGLALTEFAQQRGLHAYALRQWRDTLGLGEYRLMNTPLRDVLGSKGVHGFQRGEAGTPSLLANTNDAPRALLTFTLPPKAVSVHPGPMSGVAVGWRSPISGTVKISGRVADADGATGDGIAWNLELRRKTGARGLASGAFDNGGAQEFSAGTGAAHLAEIAVKAGETIQLAVLPKGAHICDTTVVDLTIATTDGGRVWNLAQDIVESLASGKGGNPHPDRYGNAEVWHFADMAESRAAPPSDPNAPLARFAQAMAQAGESAEGRKIIERAAEEFQKQFAAADKTSPFWIGARADEIALPPPGREKLAKLAAEWNGLRQQAPPPLEYANAAQEGGCPESPHAGTHDARVHIRGSYARLGDLVPRRFPVVLAGGKQPRIAQGSGRRELADWLASPTHPLTARVMVNRLWQGHFGQGIVRTPSNFGFLGERPTHPALLDWLAATFVEQGWSLKKMHRLMMLSAAYRQSSAPRAATLRADPDNRLFGRMNRRRLEAEAIRDNLLAVSGRLDRKMGGVATRDFDNPRRTLYLMTIRSDRSGYGPLFDMADSTASIEKRTVSTVAPQALFLLNNPFVMEQARALAKRLMSLPGGDAARLHFAYSLLYARPPSADETRIGLEFLAQFRPSGPSPAANAAKPDAATYAWEAYCQILLCANEFLTVD